MVQLLVCIAGLLLGPISYRFSRRRERLYAFFDGFVLVGVAGLILTEVLPETVEAVGAAAIFWAAAGFVLPLVLERRLALLPFSPRAFFRWLMIIGLLLHQALDGVALAENLSPGDGFSLRLAVILHQVPKGFFIWGMAGEILGARGGWAVIGSLCLATAAGFGLGGEIASVLEARPLWLFQAFIAGGLLHVIVHHVPGGASGGSCSCQGERREQDGLAGAPRGIALWSGLGALVSLAGLIAMHVSSEVEAGRFSTTFLDLSLESAPSILLGFVAAGLFQAFLPRFLFSWFQVEGRMSQALRGIAIGVPLPICSCGVVPVYLSLLKKNVPPAAALAFLIATPEIGLDSIFLSGKLLGLEITLIRIVMAFLIALAVAVTLARLFERIRGSGDPEGIAVPAGRDIPATLIGKVREAARYGGMEVVDHTAAWLLVGIAVAAAIGPDRWGPWIRSLPGDVDILVLSLIGLPLYVCASGATPLAAILIQNGVSTGAALAFLITGPSTNITTFGILKRYHGVKGALLFAAAVYGFSILIGFAINHLLPAHTPPIGEVLAHPGHGALNIGALAALAALFAGSVLRLGPRGFLGSLGQGLGGLPLLGHSHAHAHEHEHEH
jgi:uncharacterized membrane protein YraQ (UPF0718 family)